MTRDYIRYRSEYKHQLASDYRITIPILPAADIVTDFIELEGNGELTVKNGYAWALAIAESFICLPMPLCADKVWPLRIWAASTGRARSALRKIPTSVPVSTERTSCTNTSLRRSRAGSGLAACEWQILRSNLAHR